MQMPLSESVPYICVCVHARAVLWGGRAATCVAEAPSSPQASCGMCFSNEFMPQNLKTNLSYARDLCAGRAVLRCTGVRSTRNTHMCGFVSQSKTVSLSIHQEPCSTAWPSSGYRGGKWRHSTLVTRSASQGGGRTTPQTPPPPRLQRWNLLRRVAIDERRRRRSRRLRAVT